MDCRGMQPQKSAHGSSKRKASADVEFPWQRVQVHRRFPSAVPGAANAGYEGRGLSLNQEKRVPSSEPTPNYFLFLVRPLKKGSRLVMIHIVGICRDRTKTSTIYDGTRRVVHRERKRIALAEQQSSVKAPCQSSGQMSGASRSTRPPRSPQSAHQRRATGGRRCVRAGICGLISPVETR
ncbi:hypothetical protein HPB47_012964 [Ixodes persulcatus]|uniref:Uncharacterized protein n=1 Tax=Ixodes persulcatus TaxID=34615 RepID=A0AC60NS27_IXOPE|nr:hypothetical protein HPB47_012964 [Ixodes persulcatus]